MVEIIKNRSIIIVLSACAVFALGLAAGSLLGSIYLRDKIYSAKGGIFFYKPASYYSDLYRLINSSDPLERLSAYYSVNPESAGSLNFFIDRLSSEESQVNRSVLIWMIGHSSEKAKAALFLRDLLSRKAEKNKLEINSALRKLERK